MSNYFFMQICFVNKPSKRELSRLNDILSSIDHSDFPEPGFTESGFYNEWRKPLFSFQEILNICHKFGYECYGKVVEDAHNEYYKFLDDPNVDNSCDLSYYSFIDCKLNESKTYYSKPILSKRTIKRFSLGRYSRRFING